MAKEIASVQFSSSSFCALLRFLLLALRVSSRPAVSPAGVLVSCAFPVPYPLAHGMHLDATVLAPSVLPGSWGQLPSPLASFLYVILFHSPRLLVFVFTSSARTLISRNFSLIIGLAWVVGCLAKLEILQEHSCPGPKRIQPLTLPFNSFLGKARQR